MVDQVKLAQAIAKLSARHGRLQVAFEMFDYDRYGALRIADRQRGADGSLRYVDWEFNPDCDASDVAQGLRLLADQVEARFPDLLRPELDLVPK